MTTTESAPSDTANGRAAAGATSEPDEFERLAAAVDDARAAVDGLDGDAKQTALDLMEAIEAFHRPALVTLVRAMREDPRGKELLFAAVDEPEVRAVFALHGIIKADPTTRALQALDRVRPQLQSHGGDVELVSIDDGVATVRLHGACNGCSMSAVTLRDGVTDALVNGVSEVTTVEVADEPTAAFIPLSSVGRRDDRAWVKGPAVDDIADGGFVCFEPETRSAPATAVAGAEGGEPARFIVTRIANRVAVFHNRCVHQGLPLDSAMMDGETLTCPWHGFRFDASSGESVSAPGAQLDQVPARVEEGDVWIRLER